MSEEKEVKTVTIDDVKYDAKLTEKGIELVNNIQQIDLTLARHKLDFDIANLAKTSLLAELGEEKKNFTVISED